jgi:hypothetical protein
MDQCSRRKGERNTQKMVGVALSLTNEDRIVKTDFRTLWRF